ncbi:MAG: hypothetical protein K8L99_06625, partial [Anaerolineae bacterium]|nr:hypothetical protein [Anaerolineae bacterium]
MSYQSGFITPPTEEEEIYPYRRVWPSVIIEHALLAGVAVLFFLLTRFVSIPTRINQPMGIILALLPAGFWLIFSWWRERFALQPRDHLLLVALISGLVAKAIGLPLVNDVLEVKEWLSLQSAVDRIIGYTFTVGLVQAILIYLVQRYIAWPDAFRDRYDAVAYGTASAVGYTTVAGLTFVATQPSTPDVTAINIFNIAAVLTITGVLVGYGLSEVRFNKNPFVLSLVSTVALGALAAGVAVPLRTGLTNASI